ncbi:uncharacterized protein LOC132257287 [Phlebotomus argentipes]|uniref:uncharacterized protein LOC132257287 n=1 Tax=Phlebotomus argentipes TaxID=94469 RepID=UPI002892D662|nr:uncharacterized protein LOC132257287 [Phlebotomus argentipes]
MTDLVENGASEVEKSVEVTANGEDLKASYEKLEQNLQKRTTENEILKSRIACLEKEMISKAGAPKANKTECQKDDILTHAKELLFEKTKICKRQEQQIEALKIQIDSIKEVLAVSKEILEMRDLESSHLQEQVKTLETRLKAEREHHIITQKKLIISKRMLTDVRKEYELQKSIFAELRDSYKRKIEILTSELEKYKSKGSAVENQVE